MKKFGRVDSNHVEIVKALRKAGRSVRSLAPIGGGVPDLLVGYKGKNFLLEVKTDKGDLTEDQVKFVSEWRGQSCIVRNAEEAIAVTALSDF